MEELSECVLRFANEGETPVKPTRFHMEKPVGEAAEAESDEDPHALIDSESESESDDEPVHGKTAKSAPVPSPTAQGSSSSLAPDFIPLASDVAPKLEPWDPSRKIRKYRGSKRPSWCWPELWASLSLKARRDAIAEGEASQLEADKVLVSAAARAGSTVIEFCCGSDSLIGDTQIANGALVIRLTEDIDMTSKSGLQFALAKAREHPGALLMISMPCTLGTPWNNINKIRSKTHKKRTAALRVQYQALMTNATILARSVRSLGGHILREWPTGCTLWSDPLSVDFDNEFELTSVNIHGCALGLKSRVVPGSFVKKPWTLKSTSQSILSAFAGYKCPGPSETHVHTPCQGKDTKASEGYTPELAQLIHDGFQSQLADEFLSATAAAAPTKSQESLGIRRNSQESIGIHRNPYESTGIRLKGQNPGGDLDGASECSTNCADLEELLEFDLEAGTCSMSGNQGDCSTERFAQANSMPLSRFPPGKTQVHRNRVQQQVPLLNCCVHRLLSPSEARGRKTAIDALKAEGTGLTQRDTWDLLSVRERSDLLREARARGEVVHHGRVFGISSIKNDELPDGDPRKIDKGRFVYQGSDIRDQNGMTALFDQLGSNPSTMEASKACDAYGLQPGFVTEQSDCDKAYIQSFLKGPPTWASLPKDIWPAHWAAKFRDPVVLIKKAIYGHPLAGECWEERCESKILACGFARIPGWKSTFFHAVLRVMLVVYVDDLKMSGPRANVPQCWSALRSGADALEMAPPEPVDRFLGCKHTIGILPSGARTMTYDMTDFMQSCVDRYCELAPGAKLKTVETPFIDIASFPDIDFETPGHLAGCASSILMKVLWGARMMRWDLLKATSYLARHVSKWTAACDRMLHRLMSYINSTKTYTLTGTIGDLCSEWHLKLFADADLAGDKSDHKSTSGMFHCVSSPHSFFPLTAKSAKQSCVSTSTPEAEAVSAAEALRTCGLPALDLWDTLLGKPTKLIFEEDNTSFIRIMETGGNSVALRHMNRTHGINLCWLAEVFKNRQVELRYCKSTEMAADIFTKAFTNPAKWLEALAQISVGPPSKVG
jgi:hypothetical protein